MSSRFSPTVVYDMATASSRAESSHNHRGTSQLHAIGESTRPQVIRSEGVGSVPLQVKAFAVSSLFCSSPPPVSCAKIKSKKRLFGAAVYVEVTAEGESRRTTKSHSSSSPKWDERFTL